MQNAAYWETTGDEACCVLFFTVHGLALQRHAGLRSSVIVNGNPRHTADRDKPRVEAYLLAATVAGYSQILPSIGDFDDAYTRAWHAVTLRHEAVYTDVYQIKDDADGVHATLPPFFWQLPRQFTGDERQLGIKFFTKVETDRLYFHTVERRQTIATINILQAACPTA